VSGFNRRPATGGEPLSESDVREIALRYLARRDYSCAELAAKLLQRGAASEVAEAVVERLGEAGLVSDERFAEVFARYRSQGGYGPMRIRAELRQKGVKGELIEQALEPYADEWHELAFAWLSRRLRGELDRKAEARLYRGGQQRGFSHDQVMRAIERLREAG
jgi:regulatory protein